MSSPSSPDARRARFSSSFSSRFLLAASHSLRVVATNDDHAVVVGDDDVARAHVRTRADNWNSARCPVSPYRALREMTFDQTGNAHRGEFGDVAHARVDDESAHAVGAHTRGEQFAEVAILARARGGDDEEVTRLGLFDRDVNGPVVARRDLAGKCVARDAHRTIDRSKVRSEVDQYDPALRGSSRRRTVPTGPPAPRGCARCSLRPLPFFVPLLRMIPRVSRNRDTSGVIN